MEDAEAFSDVQGQVHVHAGFVVLELSARASEEPGDGHLDRYLEVEGHVRCDGEAVELANPFRRYAAGHVTRVPGSPKEVRPVQVSPKSLAKVATTANGPIYWAGALPNQTYELTRKPGVSLVRYLPPGAPIGAQTANLTVGTYTVPHAIDAVKRLAAAKGATTIKLPRGGLAVLDPHFPRSVYIAWPGSNYEIEVFDPSLARARQLVTSGQIIAAS